MIISVDPAGAKPPYEQVKEQIDGLIRRGELAQGTRLPTVRQLAGDLGLAVNTVARAYKELEADRMIETRGRNGTFVLAARSQVDDEETRAAATVLARAARRAGISLAEATEILHRAW
ncbi:GntR family transcriptional regulator [Kribbella sandramycini]|uniref:DNA-binding transcriptional regulator YhcF (GntR family) n=1 Tax=Kribbella sandramycini TaxID=60450 RepID=A0A7Y4L7C9_9ACTN|nr:GntR family transcriptional regulator [Kribbella sandramycini]MBB6570156.1 DNA-binding transcriptional regulator YhcF (GntR family) [Kribbella sandramycini]NOL45719.1 GntR family transcriptional regulator [Kribbella sandramycini]